MANKDFGAAKFFYDEPSTEKINAIKNKYGITLEKFFRILISGTGDDQAGYIFGTIDFGAAGRNNYWYITEIFSYADTGDPGYFSLKTHSDRWERFFCPGNADKTMIPFVGDHVNYLGNGYALLNKEQFNEGTLILGKPRNDDADAGLVDYYYTTNTNTANYFCHILGFCTKYPITTIF